MSDLLNEAREHVDLQPEGTGKLRLLEIISSKVFNVVSNEVALEHLISQSQRTFRIEVLCSVRVWYIEGVYITRSFFCPTTLTFWFCLCLF